MDTGNSTGLHESSTPGQWVKIDLQANKPIRPNYYCMKGPGQIGHELKNWNLEGSNDNLNWDVLSKHVDFTSWQGTIECVSFEIKGCHRKVQSIQGTLTVLSVSFTLIW
jgi:hypothetical protein